MLKTKPVFSLSLTEVDNKIFRFLEMEISLNSPLLPDISLLNLDLFFVDWKLLSYHLH